MYYRRARARFRTAFAERNILVVKATAVMHNIALAYDPQYAAEAEGNNNNFEENNQQQQYDNINENFQRRAQIVQTFT